MTVFEKTEERIEEDEINLLDYWRVIVKRKILIGGIVFIAIVASVIYSLILPPIFASTASILPPQQEGGGMAAGLMSQLGGGLGGLAGGFLGISTPVDTWLAILKSETIRDAMIHRFNQMNILEAKSMEEARTCYNEVK